jgi:glutamate synthase domain-containing protein 3
MNNGIIILTGNAGRQVGYGADDGLIYIHGNAESISEEGNNARVIVRGRVREYDEAEEYGREIEIPENVKVLGLGAESQGLSAEQTILPLGKGYDTVSSIAYTMPYDIRAYLRAAAETQRPNLGSLEYKKFRRRMSGFRDLFERDLSKLPQTEDLRLLGLF